MRVRLRTSRIQLITIYALVLVVLVLTILGVVKTDRRIAALRSERDELAGMLYRAAEFTDEEMREIATQVNELLAEPALLLADPGPDARGRSAESLWEIYRSYGPVIGRGERSYSILLGVSVFGIAVALLAGIGLDLFVRQVDKDRRRAHEFARNRIAVIGLEQRSLMLELHDAVGQNLASARLLLSTVDAPSLDGCREILDDTRRLISDIARRLYPAELDQLGLSSALQQLVEDYQRIGDAQVHLTVSPAADEAIDDATRIHVYRIAQEALTNALAHSGARRITVVLERVADTVWLVVNDDGKGFRTDRSQGSPGFGIMSMNERARIVEGTLAVLSRPGHGTRVSLQFPVRVEVSP